MLGLAVESGVLASMDGKDKKTDDDVDTWARQGF